MLMVWFERKVIAGMQNRIGPDKAGPFGIAADAGRRHQAVLQGRPDPRTQRPVRVQAGAVPGVRAGLPGVVASSRSAATSPTARTASSASSGTTTKLQLADPPIGVLLLLALSSIAVYGIMLAGWSSGSKYPLLGSVRASAQMVSYEAALGLSIADGHPDRRHAEHQRHRQRAERHRQLAPRRHRRAAVRRSSSSPPPPS